jgi:SAM-dependent methyltransferase
VEESAYGLHAEVEERHWWFVARRRILQSVLDELALPASARLLDFGSGTGGNLPLLSHYGRVCAIEPSDEARRVSAARAPEVEHHARLEALPAERFHAAFLLDVFEHLDDPPAALRQIAAHLHPGARLVVTVPAHPWMFGEHDRYLHHRRRYTERALRHDLAEGGFTVEALSPMNTALFPAAVAARGLEWLRGRIRPERAAEPRGMRVPPFPLNRALTLIFAAERALIPKHRLPFGLSFIALATRTS